MKVEDSVEKRIVAVAEEEFLRYGYTRVTTDQIARKLSISKKTLYKYFAGKKELLDAVFEKTKDGWREVTEPIIHDKKLSFIEKFVVLGKNISERTERMNSPLMRDIMAHEPELWRNLEAHRCELVQQLFRVFYEEGVEKRYFDGSRNTELTVQMYFHIINNIMRPDVFATLPMTGSEIYGEVIRVIFLGITSEARRQEIKESIARINMDLRSKNSVKSTKEMSSKEMSKASLLTKSKKSKSNGETLTARSGVSGSLQKPANPSRTLQKKNNQIVKRKNK